MKIPSFSTLTLTLIIFFISTFSPAATADGHNHFLECLSEYSDNHASISNLVYTKANSSYTSILQAAIWNLRFTTESTPKPQVIIAPNHESQIPPIIRCAKQTGLEIRTRSGGHDMEGLSYRSQVPFVVIDLFNLGEVAVDAEAKTAWLGAGATLGALYYHISQKSLLLGFPAGFCPTVGSGGHFSGGGDGTLVRKYGMAADNIIDARIVDARGKILDRESMGEDLFWAIRGGGGASFGVIVAWKVQLVDVPETVTVFQVSKTLEQNATELVQKWQSVAPYADKDLFVGILLNRVGSTVSANFFSLFLGRADRLVALVQETFPELGLVREDCAEMSWIDSVVSFGRFTSALPLDLQTPADLLIRKDPNLRFLKMKSDFVEKPLPEEGVRGLLNLLFAPEAVAGLIAFIPHGGRTAEISESALPFPHRAGNLFKVETIVYWQDNENAQRYVDWMKRYYDYMTPYVSSNPRSAYVNYRDLDFGVNNVEGRTSYAKASVWGKRYYKNNFDRLVLVKTMVDPENFFRFEQSIPPIHSWSSDQGVCPI
ncbi:cannabidiolic acid synthase-like [Salvia splendens]|uniref:cannabidiolic acid synthase-like n=1 Tax=Salvia splendens TaxID=180675 RepID=UPI001103D3D0|nr:cannabidiolic acid synthase-like [Salvia splendens]